MLKRDYFLAALKNKSYLYKSWIIGCFGLTNLSDKPASGGASVVNSSALFFAGEPERQEYEKYPFQLFKDADNRIVFFNPEINDWDVLQGAEFGKVPFRFKDVIELNPGDLPNLDTKVKTFIGNALVNQVLICHAFGNRIPFQMGEVSVKKVEALIAEKLMSVPEDNEVRDPKLIYTDELEEHYYPAAYSITGWCQLATPAATPYTIVTSPDMAALRKRLLEENRDKLDDPVVIARIIGQLVAHDKAFQDQDPEKGFLKPGKDFDVIRAKMFLMHGIENDFSNPGKITLIENPLDEGWDITKLPAMANSLIDGSFYRGAMTALGGEAAKYLGRFFLNTVLSEDDCGSKLGMRHELTQENVNDLTWTYEITGGEDLLLTPELIQQKMGQVLTLRSPQFCQTGDGNFCVHCIGKRFENSKTAMGALAVEAGNVLMLLMMSKMHGTSLKTTKLDWRKSLR